MPEKSIVEFVEEWQTGFFLVIGTVLVGVLSGALAASAFGPPGFLFGLVGGAVAAFLAFSYLLYGRRTR